MKEGIWELIEFLQEVKDDELEEVEGLIREADFYRKHGTKQSIRKAESNEKSAEIERRRAEDMDMVIVRLRDILRREDK